MARSEQIKAEIEDRIGFFPIFFAPAQHDAQVLENLWQYTLSAYVNNPLSSLLKEKLSAYLSRYCAVPYCMICHSCSLRPLGMKARDVLQLLESPPPSATDIEKHLNFLAAQTEAIASSTLNAALEQSLLYCSIYIFLEREEAQNIRKSLRRLLEPSTYQHLVSFVAYVKACHVWMENFPEVGYEADKRAIENLDALLEEEPGLVDFFRNYRQIVKRELQAQTEQLEQIEECKRNEVALKQSEERFRLLAENSTDMISRHTAEGVYLYVSPASRTLLGYDPEDLIGHSAYEFFHPEDLAEIAKAHTNILELVDINTVAYRIRNCSGNYIWCETTSRTIRDEKTGDVIEIYASSRDITSRKAVEQELIRANKRIVNILESITDAFYSLDCQWKFNYINPQAERFLQKKRDELLDKNIWEEFPKLAEGESVLFTQYHKAVSEQKAVAFEEFYPCINAWFEVHAYPSLEGLSVYFNDISDRKRSSETLQHREQQFAALLRNNPDVIIRCDRQVRYVYVNQAVERLLGKAAAEILGKTSQELGIPQELCQLWEETVRLVFETGMEQSIEFESPSTDGLRSYQSRVVPEFYEGLTKYALIVSRDITEIKRVQEELERQNRRSQLFAEIALKIRQSLQIDEILQTTVTEVQKILNSDRVLIYRLWPDGSGTGVTEAVVPGWPSVLGQTFSQEVFPQDFQQLYCEGRIRAIADLNNSVETSSCVVEFLHQFGVKAKLVVPILLKEDLWGLLIAHQCDRPRKWQSFEVDLLQQLATQVGIALAQAQLLEQETRQRSELLRSNDQLQQFAYVASHDLQEPLRKIQAFGDRLKDKCNSALTDQGRDYLERMQNAAKRMQVLIDDLLTFSRVTSKAKAFERVDLSVVVSEVLSDLEVGIDRTGGRVEVGDLSVIEAEPIQIRQLLQNLISNALKFHRNDHPPIVKIYGQLLNPSEKRSSGGSTIADLYQIIVEDNGIGFDEKYLDRIFNVFQRLHGRSAYEGTGMGLAICRKIAELHGGSLEAKSTPGQGARFIVTLPFKQPKE